MRRNHEAGRFAASTKRIGLYGLLVAWPFACPGPAAAAAAQGRLHLLGADGDILLQVEGSADDDWRFQTSTDLVIWQDAPELGTLLSGDAGAPARSVGDRDAPRCFFRATRTDGLYDATVLRTISLTFALPNWQTTLARNRATGANLAADLAMDNGAVVAGAGVRYKGNTSYTGMGGGGAPTKKSLNIELDFTDPESRLMAHKTVNVNNAYGDETIMREPLYFNVMSRYTVCPKGGFAKLYINGAYWGVYSLIQQENNDLIGEWFSSDKGDRWKAPNMGGGGGPGGGGMGGGESALSYLGANASAYQTRYELKTQNSGNPWQYLVHAADVLNNAPADQLRDKVEDVLAVDRWLWFLAIENIFADEDSYYFKGADYGFYYEPESGRIHPVEHDGNESFTANQVSLSPVEGAASTSRPVLRRLLGVPELRQRYLAHMRTVLEESFNPERLFPLIEQHAALTRAEIEADPKKSYTMAAYDRDLTALKSFVTNRHAFLTSHAELRPLAPVIVEVSCPAYPPGPGRAALVTAMVQPSGGNGLDSVWLYHRGKPYGRFAVAQMFDDGAHGDAAAGDGLFGAQAAGYPAGTKVRLYVEARSASSAKATSFSPARAEQETHTYRVAVITAESTPVVINELMADNAAAVPDPQGEYDDWIELRNVTDEDVDLTGRYLSDESDNLRKWQFPDGTTIRAGAYLVVWADEDETDTAGVHASFKLAGTGEQVFLSDRDERFNAVLDSIRFDEQPTDVSYGRSVENPNLWMFLEPTPGTGNEAAAAPRG